MAAVPHYPTETEASTAFDAAVAACGLFTPYFEVPGTLTQPRPGQVDKTLRIDRLLVPNDRLLSLGWRYGIVGVEIKRSGIKAGPAIAQAMDYARAVWTLPGSKFQVVPSWIFLWHMDPPGGPLESVMAQNRIGSARSTGWARLELKTGGMNILRVGLDGSVRVGVTTVGAKVGSR